MLSAQKKKKKNYTGKIPTFNVIGIVCVLGGGRGWGAEITVNVTPPPLSIIHFQSIVVPGCVRQLGDDASKMGSIA